MCDLDILRPIGLSETLLILLKVDPFEALLFDWVTNNCAVCESERMSTTESKRRIFIFVEDFVHSMGLFSFLSSSAEASNSPDLEVVLSQRSRLIKAANVDLASHRDAVGFRAENLLLHELDDGVVHGDRELHRKLGRNDISDNKNATEHNLVATSVRVLKALREDVVTGGEGENEQDEQVGVDLRLLN